ncbi:MAG: HAD family hydrolase [Phycisphaerales bacterium]
MNTTEWDVLVVDLDGTLLCKQGEVSEQNLHALDSVRELGIEVVVATGRSFRECKHIEYV